MGTSVLLKDNENECPARVQGGQVSCSGTMKTSVLLRDNEKEWLAQGQ